VGARAGLDVLEKRKIFLLLGIEPRPSSQWSVAIPTELFLLIIDSTKLKSIMVGNYIVS
jgi:hypothetical protein